MPQMSNIEPMRSSSKSKYKQQRMHTKKRHEIRCTTCGEPVRKGLFGPVPFCRDCLDWSAKDNLDEYWDDIGTVD